MPEMLLEVDGLRKDFIVGPMFRRKTVRAVRNVSFSVRRGETLGIVGESGCGKSTTGRLAIRLIEPTQGRIRFKGEDLRTVERHHMRELRRNLQIIFQDPFASLDPRMTVEAILREPLYIQGIGSDAERRERVRAIMAEVGLLASHASRYPHEFSGGQRQRIGIARSLILNPELIVADEPVSALDVSVQAQVLNLMQDIQQKHELSYIFISHDLSVVKHICDRVAVMYLGEIVETGDRDSLFSDPLHPYTQALMSAIPGRKGVRRVVLKGDIPNPASPPSGCAFHTRCPRAMPRCRQEAPRLKGDSDKTVACHLYE
jgi:oligopeptide transport system ATP-binding protein